jgi:hypothetical protein
MDSYKMPVCRLIPGMHEKDQCEEIPGFWTDLDNESRARCKQQTPCGPVIPVSAVNNPWGGGGKRRNRRKASRKASRKAPRKASRKAHRKAHRKY